MKICKKFEFPTIKNWDKYSHLLEKKISWFSLISYNAKGCTYIGTVLIMKASMAMS